MDFSGMMSAALARQSEIIGQERESALALKLKSAEIEKTAQEARATETSKIRNTLTSQDTQGVVSAFKQAGVDVSADFQPGTEMGLETAKNIGQLAILRAQQSVIPRPVTPKIRYDDVTGLPMSEDTYNQYGTLENRKAFPTAEADRSNALILHKFSKASRNIMGLYLAAKAAPKTAGLENVGVVGGDIASAMGRMKPANEILDTTAKAENMAATAEYAALAKTSSRLSTIGANMTMDTFPNSKTPPETAKTKFMNQQLFIYEAMNNLKMPPDAISKSFSPEVLEELQMTVQKYGGLERLPDLVYTSNGFVNTKEVSDQLPKSNPLDEHFKKLREQYNEGNRNQQ